MTGVVSSLSSASCCACRHTLVVGLDLRKAEEFVAHIRISVGDWVVGSVNGTAKFDGTREAGLGRRRSVLVVSIAATDHYMEAVCGNG